MSLSLQNISLTVGGQHHLRDIALTLERGTVNVLLGPTRSGKTSLMRVMAGLDPATSGRMTADGHDVTSLPVKKRSVAMVYQQFINYPALTVYENIASPLRVRGATRAEIDQRVRAAAALLKLDNQLDKTPLKLSGGQQQRCAIARAVVRQADLVLLDEPLANLDYKLREELREELPRIFASTGAVFVYATTEPTEALLLGGNTATLLEGAVTQFGPTAEVYRRPADLATARVFSDPPLNALRVTKQAHTVLMENGTVLPATGPLAHVPNGTYTIGVRAHHLEVEDVATAERTPPADGLIRLGASVAVTEVTGSESFLHMDMGAERLTALVAGVRRLEADAPVEVLIDPRHILLFDADGRRVAGARDAAAA